MILALVIALQQEQLPVKLKQLEIPVMGGIREIVLGPVERGNDTIGLFINNYDKMYDESGKIPVNFINPRIGSISSACRKALLGDQTCFQIDTESTRTQELKFAYQIHPLRMNLKRQWWVTAEGRILAETFRLDAAGNTWTMDAKYGKDDYTVILSSPERGRWTLAGVNPHMGMDEVAGTAFKPMVKLPDEVVSAEKSFYLLDPFTGAPVKHQAKVKGKFSGSWEDDRVKGTQIEITGGIEKQVVNISDRGLMIKAALEKYKYLSLLPDG